MTLSPVSGKKISIQVSLGGFSFDSSPWLEPGRIFSTPELGQVYDEVELSLLTHKCAVVPSAFFSPESAASLLSSSVSLDPSDEVDHVDVPWYDAVLVYSTSIGESLSKVLSGMLRTSGGGPVKVLPELYYLLKASRNLPGHNKIAASYHAPWLHLAVAEGSSLRLANSFRAPDFTTAEYFIFLSLKKLQLNPEMSAIAFRTPLTMDEEISLCRYFNSVERI